MTLSTDTYADQPGQATTSTEREDLLATLANTGTSCATRCGG